MALRIETFSNTKGGETLFKALGHPLAVGPMQALIARLGRAGPLAIYDPLGIAEALGALYDLAPARLAGIFAQDVRDIGREILGHRAQPVTDLPGSGARSVLVAAFDAARLIDHVRHLVPVDAEIASLDAARLPPEMIGHPRLYLDPLNFATNFAFFRDEGERHSRVTTANYWHGYGAAEVTLHLWLIDGDGTVIASWSEPLPAGTAGVAIDSRAVRSRFGLGEFCGQLFMHVVGARGHEVVKYALDLYGDRPEELTCTHDANAWPADFYAGLPAPKPDERVLLWVQNSHPCPIPAGAVGLNLMGSDAVAWLDRPVAPFASTALDVATLLPAARWPQQIEIRAGRHFVRPRYEIVRADGRRRVAHPNVERIDLKPDPRLPELGNLLGKGFILPAPVLPPDRYRSLVLPTPMATTQADLPLRLTVYDATGREMAQEFLGRLPRDHAQAVDVGTLLGGTALPSGYGHLELAYDFRDGGEADGWLHALFRYEDRRSGHAAETSFGAHVFNTVVTYKAEPQSYAGRPPGLSTRLFLRLGDAPLDTLCHLIYPASTPWHAHSATALILHDRAGAEIARREVRIACGGSLHWHARAMFGAADIDRAGPGAYAVVRDTTCRLFGYHGLVDGDQAFSLDHMFGF